MDEPLLDADPGGDSRDALSPSWLEPQNDALHHAPLMSGGHEGEAPASDPWSWATHPTPAEAGGSPGPARLLLGRFRFRSRSRSRSRCLYRCRYRNRCRSRQCL